MDKNPAKWQTKGCFRGVSEAEKQLKDHSLRQRTLAVAVTAASIIT
jgi:hypothetical protein